MKIISIVTLWLLPALCMAQSLSLNINSEPNEVVLGIPFVVEVRLSSDESFILHGPFGLCDDHTQIILKDDSGNPLGPYEFGCPLVSATPFDSDRKITYEGLAMTEAEIYLPVGTFRISAEYHSTGPYLDRYSDTDQRPVEGIWIGELTSNEVEVTVKNPEGDDQNALLNLGLSPEESRSPEKLSSFLKANDEDILKNYPKSSYAAWIRWTMGKIWFHDYGGLDSSVQEDIAYQNFLRGIDKVEPIAGSSNYREKIQRVIDIWFPLYRDFPKFIKRAFVLRGLAQAYIRQGQYQKAKPLLIELLERYPKTEEARKAIEYKEVMVKKGLWKE